jgi:hypothetical protein
MDTNGAVTIGGVTIDPHTTTFNDLDRIAAERGRKGYVAAASADGTAGQLHWTQAAEVNGRWNQQVAGETATLEQRAIARLHEGLPEVKRRTAQERFRVLFERLVEQAMTSYRTYGYPVWPRTRMEAERPRRVRPMLRLGEAAVHRSGQQAASEGPAQVRARLARRV